MEKIQKEMPVALKQNTNKEYKFESIRSFGGTESLKPIDYSVLKSTNQKLESISLIDQVQAKMSRLELMQRELGLLSSEIEHLIIKK